MLVTVLLGGTVAAPASAAAPSRGTAATTSTSPPTGDAFYLPPEPLTPAKPGRLIRAEAIPAPEGARAWRVLHHSRSPAGDDIAVSGIVVAPAGPAPKGGRPVVAWAHGTTGLADSCAPSKSADAATRLPWLTEMLAAGYVVTATDYAGLGTPGVHPYLVGESEGRSVLDTIRVARDLPTGASRRAAVVGHSQGGQAALFAGEIAADYAPELSLRGIAAGAPVSDVDGFLGHAAGTPGTVGFLVMGAAGYRAAYPELATIPLLAPSIEARSDVAVFGCAGQALLAFLGDDVRTVFLRDPATIPAWAARLRENTAGNRPAGAPVLVWQGDDDALTPASLNARYATRACGAGSVVDYRLYPGANHGSVLGAAQDDVLAFLAARFAGTKPVSTCAG